MQLIDATEGEVILVGNMPVGILSARGKRVRLVASSVVQETEEDLRRFLKRQRRRETLDTHQPQGQQSP